MSVRLAVIGAGHLGKIHARLATTHADATVVGVADPSDTARNLIEKDLGVDTFADFHELIPRIDAAIVAASTPTHYEICRELLQHGKHCLVEKPITTTTADADELIELAAKQGAVFSVGHVERFNPAFEAAREQVSQPKFIKAERLTGYGFRSTDVGVVLDLMIHDIDLTLALVNSPVVEVEALGLAVFGPHEDLAQARLKFANGCVADISAGRTCMSPSRRMDVFSESGYTGIDFASRCTKTISPDARLWAQQINVDALTDQQKNQIKESLFESGGLLPVSVSAATEANPLLDEQADFLQCVRFGGTPRVTATAAREALAVAHQVLRSLGDHRWDDSHHGPTGPHFEIVHATPETATVLMTPPMTPPDAPSLAPFEQPPRRKAG